MGHLSGVTLARKFRSSKRLQDVINAQHQSTIKNTNANLVSYMMWSLFLYMKVKESDLILPHLSILKKAEFDDIRNMYLNEVVKMSLVGVTAGNKGLNSL